MPGLCTPRRRKMLEVRPRVRDPSRATYMIRDKSRPLQQQLLTILGAAKNGLSCSQACRSLNSVGAEICYNCRDYGNSWKRRRGILVRPSCEIRKGRVWYRLQQLERAGLCTSQREKRPDGKMVRGWDNMRIYYAVPNRWISPEALS